MSFLTAIWLLPVALLLHEAEEWNILRWEQRNFVNLPAKTNVSVRTFFRQHCHAAVSGHEPYRHGVIEMAAYTRC